MLVIVRRMESNRSSSADVLCRCDCGNERVVMYGNLKNGDTQSCGCLRRRVSGAKNRTHGLTRTPTHAIWVAMRDRCNNPNNIAFRVYGGRGIRVCDRWNDFANFLADMGERPVDMTIDRRDPNGNYCPENCCWATRQEQGLTMRKTRRLSVDGVDYSCNRFATHFRLSSYMVLKLAREGATGPDILARLSAGDRGTPQTTATQTGLRQPASDGVC